MIKKISISLVFMFVAGLCFSQANFDEMPRHTITVDFGPTIIGVGIGPIVDNFVPLIDTDGSSGFGFGLQYEYQIHPRASVAGRFSHMRVGLDYVGPNEEKYLLRISSFSMEAHGRYFPFGDMFFLSGMLGYAHLSIGGVSGFSALFDFGENTNDSGEKSYFKLGLRMGWRISASESGGFTFEPSLGWFWGLGGGETLGSRMYSDPNDAKAFDEYASLLANWGFVGGPRFTLAFGWRF